MYAEPLRDAADRFRREHLGSDDETDKTILFDWTNIKVRVLYRDKGYEQGKSVTSERK